jgi:GAF domain-containing protein
MRGSIKGLIGKLRESTGKLEEYSRTLEQKVDERTQKLSDALNELRALNEVGQAVSSTLDLETVLTRIGACATKLSGTDTAAIYEYDEKTERLFLRATYEVEKELAEWLRLHPVRIGEGAIGRAAVERKPIQISNVFEAGIFEGPMIELMKRIGLQASLVAIPLLREDRVVGGLVVSHRTLGYLPQEIIDRLQNFATQSVLAIQNAQLFQELEARTRELARSVGELKALGEVGQAVSSTLDLPTVLTGIVSHAVQLSGTDAGAIYEYEEAAEEFHLRASYRM